MWRKREPKDSRIDPLETMKVWTKLVDVIINRLTEYATYKAMLLASLN